MKSYSQNRILNVVFAVALCVLFSPRMHAQGGQATQVVMLQVLELSKIDLIGGSIKLQIDGASENAFEPDPSIDVSTKLLWTSNGENRKITVGSDNASPRFTLRVAAESISPGAGLAAPEVMLSSNEPHDLILGVRRSAGSCKLKFTALASAEEGIGSESHLVTYTITGG
jgi:hypothetical protein